MCSMEWRVDKLTHDPETGEWIIQHKHKKKKNKKGKTKK